MLQLLTSVPLPGERRGAFSIWNEYLINLGTFILFTIITVIEISFRERRECFIFVNQ